MRRAPAALLALLLLAACQQRDAGAAALDAGADQRNQTAAKTLADLAAADRASGADRARPAAR